mgnify:CR=1 FL=1
MQSTRASEIMAQGSVCSESVLQAVCEKYHIENEIIPRIAHYFGGGFGNMGSICGAVCGAMMAFSLVTEPDAADAEMPRRAALVPEFCRRFAAEMGSLNCRDLTGIDMLTKAGRKQWTSLELGPRVCYPAVDLAYRLVLELLEESA